MEKVGWVLVRDGRLLVARNHGRSLFYLPGGRRERGESHVQTLAREAREELSVTIDVSSLRHVVTVIAPRDGQPGVVHMACYLAQHTGCPMASGEVAELAWVTAEQTDRVTAAEQQLLELLLARNQLLAR